MHNIYFLESDNYKIINEKIEEILKENKISNDCLVTYDMDTVSVSDAIIDLDTYSFFNEPKVIYCKNALFLTTIKSPIEHNIDLLSKYLSNPNPSNILIISSPKVDGKKNIVKLLREKAICVDMEFNLPKYIKKRSEGYKISDTTIDYLIEVTLSDILRIDNELDKLLEYTLDKKEITKKDIDLIVIKKIDMNIYDLIDAIISKNKKKSLTIYNEMINYGEDVFRIFISLANQIRLIYQVKVLRNLSNEEIKEKLNLKNPKQVVALRYKIDKYREEDLLNYLYRLSIMDEELKTGKSIDKIVFPIFIASL